MTKPRFALFAPYLPAPAHSGGRIRIQQFARALARVGEVSLFACADARDLATHGTDPGLDVYVEKHLVEAGSAWFPSGGRPARVRRCAPPRLLRAFSAAHARLGFSALIVEHVHAAGVALQQQALPWLLDEHNIESDYLSARLRAAGPGRMLASRSELSALARWERRAWRAATRVVCVSQSEADLIAVASGRMPRVIANGVPVRDIPFVLPSERAGHELLFVGVMGHPPNAAAARWLATEVLPLVRRAEPRAKLVLCGADPSARVAALAGPNVEVTGRVASVLPYLRRAAVYVNAIREGAGSSLKVIEALASGAPLVSTARGVRGFAVEDGRHYLHAESAEQFAGAVLAAMNAPAALDEVALRGRQIAEAHDLVSLAEEFAGLACQVAGGERICQVPGSARCA
jgi:glycosyltransferase involved in cell wall biosynthesis